jgi:gamma-glutamyltranspeptidase/glutathione hydrolase
MTTPLAIATTSSIAAQAGESVARAGGNAVDAAIAATLVSINTEPGVCSLGCGGFITIWPPGGEPVTLDGYVAAPGKNTTIEDADRNSVEVHLEYGGGVRTVVGPDSVGVPGAIAVLGAASKEFGKLPWQSVFEPAIKIVRKGFPLPEASYNYLIHSGEKIFGRSADGHSALHHPDGRLKNAGEIIRVPHLAETLERIARHGPEEFYCGEIGRAISQYSIDAGGRLSVEDMTTYEVLRRPSLIVKSGDWQIATNPPPAVGGTVLAAMLKMISRHAITQWNLESVQYLVDVQRAALGYRRDHLDLSEHMTDDAARLLDLADSGDPMAVLQSGSTCHTSVVDSSGLACSITTSAGYGAGDMPPNTGIWLNNCVGELELNKRGMNIGPPGIRLPSNMAPSVATNRDGEVLAIGSPGADRITTALLQTLVNYIMLDMPLTDAIEYPRVHVELGQDDYCVAYEAGVPVDQLAVPQRKFDSRSMFFGGVGAAKWSPITGFTVAADPRRNGGVWSSDIQK